MYPNLFQALGESRIRDWHEQAARDRLIKQARRARREAASAARLPRLRAGVPAGGAGLVGPGRRAGRRGG